jgi:hypothetical protein
MDFGLWRQNVIDAARRAADRTYQQRVWFGQGPEVDSPNELLCTFLDDLVFEEFLVHPKLSHRERTAASHLYKTVETYADCTPKTLKPSDVIDDPRFESVRRAAAEFLRVAEGQPNRC